MIWQCQFLSSEKLCLFLQSDIVYKQIMERVCSCENPTYFYSSAFTSLPTKCSGGALVIWAYWFKLKNHPSALHHSLYFQISLLLLIFLGTNRWIKQYSKDALQLRWTCYCLKMPYCSFLWCIFFCYFFLFQFYCRKSTSVTSLFYRSNVSVLASWIDWECPLFKKKKKNSQRSFCLGDTQDKTS